MLETLVTGSMPVEEGHEDPNDDVMLMQTYAQLHGHATHHVGALQKLLDKEPGKYKEELRMLLITVENRYRGVIPWELWGDAAQSLHALLTVHSEGCAAPLLQPLTDLGRQFVRHWWSIFLPLFIKLDRLNPELDGTNLVTVAPSPPPEPLSPTTMHAEEELRVRMEIEDQAVRDSQEEAELMSFVEQHQEEERAAAYRAWEESVLQEEMNSRNKQPRLMLRVEVKPTGPLAAGVDDAPSSSSSATLASTSLVLPVPQPHQGLDIRLRLDRVETVEAGTSGEDVATEVVQVPIVLSLLLPSRGLPELLPTPIPMMSQSSCKRLGDSNVASVAWLIFDSG